MKINNNSVKSVEIPSFFGPYFLVFTPNAGTYGPEKPLIWTIFTQGITIISRIYKAVYHNGLLSPHLKALKLDKHRGSLLEENRVNT